MILELIRISGFQVLFEKHFILGNGFCWSGDAHGTGELTDLAEEEWTDVNAACQCAGIVVKLLDGMERGRIYHRRR